MHELLPNLFLDTKSNDKCYCNFCKHFKAFDKDISPVLERLSVGACKCFDIFVYSYNSKPCVNYEYSPLVDGYGAWSEKYLVEYTDTKEIVSNLYKDIITYQSNLKREDRTDSYVKSVKKLYNVDIE